MTRKFYTKTDYDSLTLSFIPIAPRYSVNGTYEAAIGSPIVYNLSELSTDTVARLALVGLRQTLIDATIGIASPRDASEAITTRFIKIRKIGYPRKR